MSNKFLMELLAEGEKHSAKPEFVTIARMIIKFGYSGFVSGQRPANFFKPYNMGESKRVAKEVSARLRKAGSRSDAVVAIMLKVPVDTNTSEKVTWDIEQVALFDAREDSEYQILLKALQDSAFPVGEWFWGSYKNIEVGEYKNKDGETKKRYLSVPAEKFADEAEAMAMAGGGANQPQDQWSSKAIETYEDIKSLEDAANEIHNWLKEAQAGKPFNNDGENYPLPVPATPPKLKQYIAEIYGIESSDIDLLIPF